MKVTFQCAQFTVEVDVKDEKELFEKVADFQEIFNNVYVDPTTKEVDKYLVYNVRESDGNKFYEVVSRRFRKRLQFGQKKSGGALFPKEWVDLWQGAGVESQEEAPAPSPKKSGKAKQGETPF